MRAVERIIDQLQRAWEGDAWYGPSTREVLEGIESGQAAARPISGGHSIWEIVLHMRGWKREVWNRLEGGFREVPEGGDWPQVRETTERAWLAALEDLAATHEALVKAALAFPDERLREVIGEQRDPATGAGVSYYGMLHGIVQHDVYHTGQIALLKKADSLLDDAREVASREKTSQSLD